MSRRAKLHGPVLERAIEMRETEGRSLNAIGRELGVSVGALSWQFLRLGVEGPRAPVPDRGGPMVCMRGGRQVRRYTPEEDELVVRLSRQGVSNRAIGRQLVPPRAAHSVLGRLLTLARHEARAEAP